MNKECFNLLTLLNNFTSHFSVTGALVEIHKNMEPVFIHRRQLDTRLVSTDLITSTLTVFLFGLLKLNQMS